MSSNIRYGKSLHGLRQLVKRFFSGMYPFIKWLYKFPTVLSIDDTLNAIIDHQRSISRFGDGEFLYIIDKLDLPFQKYDSRLAEKLKVILRSDNENILVGLPIGYSSMDELTEDGKLFWRAQISWIYPRLNKYLDTTKTYYNAHMTRLYMTINNKNKSHYYFEKLMGLWHNRDIIIVEGEKSRLGVGNNLFESAKSVSRILAPAHHAFSCYDKLRNYIEENISTRTLILIALGPTATALAYDLSQCSYQAIDIGNLDIEYEWFLTGANSKTKVPYKYTSEAPMGREVDDCEDPKYLSEIIVHINS